MTVRLKTLGLLAAAALVLALAGCSAGGCTRSQLVLVPAGASILHAEVLSMRAYLHTDVYGRGLGFGEVTAKRDANVTAARWSVRGPMQPDGSLAATVTGSGDRASFYATRPGTYTVECRVTSPVRASAGAVVVVRGDPAVPIIGKGRVATPVPPEGLPVAVLDTFNDLGVGPGATPPTFTLAKQATLLTVQTYHWVGGGGPEPGTLALRSADGKTYGPWQAFGLDGRGDTANALWNVDPLVTIPPGTYTVVDSHPSNWSSNELAKGVGFTRVLVVYDR